MNWLTKFMKFIQEIKKSRIRRIKELNLQEAIQSPSIKFYPPKNKNDRLNRRYSSKIFPEIIALSAVEGEMNYRQEYSYLDSFSSYRKELNIVTDFSRYDYVAVIMAREGSDYRPNNNGIEIYTSRRPGLSSIQVSSIQQINSLHDDSLKTFLRLLYKNLEM